MSECENVGLLHQQVSKSSDKAVGYLRADERKREFNLSWNWMDGWMDVCGGENASYAFVFPASKIPGGRLSVQFHELEGRCERLNRTGEN